MATYSSIPAWKIPRTEQPGRLHPKGSQRVRHDLVAEHTHIHTHTHPFPSNPRKPPFYFLTPDLPILGHFI